MNWTQGSLLIDALNDIVLLPTTNLNFYGHFLCIIGLLLAVHRYDGRQDLDLRYELGVTPVHRRKAR